MLAFHSMINMMAAKEGKCQICGEVRPLTREHLPQQALYPKSIRHLAGNLNTVAACAECNNSSNVVDELLKVCIGQIADAPWSKELRESVDSTLSKNQRLLRLVNENTRIENFIAANGNTVRAGVFKLPTELNESLMGAIERIVKALFYQHCGKVLIEHYEISVFHPDVIHPELSKKNV